MWSPVWIFLTGFSLVLALTDYEADPEDIEEEIAPNHGFIPFLMPNIRPSVVDSYICTSMKLNQSETRYIIHFRPNATAATVHHMLMYGCFSKPGSYQAYWKCGMVCSGRSRVMYGWAKDAPELFLPPEVGFNVGRGSGLKYLVLQVHYSNVAPFKGGKRDNSGVFLHYTTEPQPKSAGVFMLSTGGVIKPHSTAHMESACQIKEDKVIHPFAFRTHTHTLGRVVSGYRVRKAKGHGDDWKLIGKKNPQLPQMFYPVQNELEIRKGDIIASRCTMKSERKITTTVGSTNWHEMCNFYMMYWVDGGNLLKQVHCTSAGPPSFSWSWYGLKNIPKDASQLDE